jgi:acyl-CoA hydrolase
VTDDLTAEELATAERIRPHLRRGALVALADGAGAPRGLGRPLAHAARQVGGVRLLLGWSFERPVPLDAAAFPDVRAIIGGYGLRPGPEGLVVGSEVGWAPAAVGAGATVLAEVNHGLPAASREPALRDVTVVAETHRAPVSLPLPVLDDASQAIGKHVAALVPPGAGVQFGPGGVGDAVLRALEVPVRVDSGIVGDAVIDLAARGLLVGTPLATYLAGTSAVYEWADRRPILARIEHTHDPSRLSGQPLVAVNTALEVDLTGQVNVEGFGGDVVAGVGGHPDFAGAAVRSLAGLSVVALPTVRGGRRTLVERLGAPVSTSRSDVDVVVTEFGVADLRGLDDRERAAALRAVWGD